MTVKQISKITLKEGNKADLPDSLSQSEMCFTLDSGEVLIGAPNLPAVQYRSTTNPSNNGQGIYPYRNVKILTEFDVSREITGDFTINGPLDRTILPISDQPSKIYSFQPGMNSIIVHYSLYDGVNVNLVGELFISGFGDDIMVCGAGQIVPGINFNAKRNSNDEIELYGVNDTSSIYTMYISAKCWASNIAEWEGTKGNGVKPECLNMVDEQNGLPSISICTDVNLTDLSDKQFLQYNILDKKWENKTISYSDISGDIPEGKSRISELLDVKLTNLSDNQILKFNTTDNLWENTTISYSDIVGTPPVTLPSIATCTDVTLSNLTDKNFLQFNATDKKWENVTINYSDISGEVPSGKQYLSTLLDVKLTNPSNNQYLKYSSADQKWENTSINYSDITGTPPVTTPSIASCSDVKLTSLANSQILKYNSTDQKWENAVMPPAQAAWTVSSVIASGSTIADATKCTSTLINVAASDGYSQGISSITYDSTARNSNNIMGYIVCSVKDGSNLDMDQSTIREYTYNHDVNYAGYNAPVMTGSGSGATLRFVPSGWSSYLDTLELSIKLFSVSPTVGDIITGTFYYDANSNVSMVASTKFIDFTVTSVTSTSVTLKNNNNGQNFPKGSSYSDIMNSKKNDIIYVNSGNPRNDYGMMFVEGDAYISSASYSQPFTVYEESNKKYKFTLNYPQYIISSKQYMIITGFSNVSVNSPGSNYAVGDKISLYNCEYYRVTTITSVPTRGIVMPDPQPTGSMVIVKNNTNNKPINVYSTTVSGNGNLLANIPDSTYKNYETKFIKTDNGWTKF